MNIFGDMMCFRGWLNLAEGSGVTSPLQNSLIRFQSNPNDDSAKSDFYSKVVTFVRGFSVKKDPSQDFADELVSLVVTKLLRKFSDLDFLNSMDPIRFPKYLATVAGNLRTDVLRRSGLRGSVSLYSGSEDGGGLIKDIAAGGLSVDDEVDSRELGERVRRAVNQLRDSDRELIKMLFYQGMQYSEIAEKLNIPLGTAKSRLYDVKEKLRKIMENE
jgi:RNA polymerase sigma factor (sigma-70 family)